MATKESWKELLLEIQTTLNKGRKNLFYAVKKATKLFENQEFRDEYDLHHDDSIALWFTTNLFSDYGLNFYALKEIYKQNPNYKDWEGKTVSELYDNLQVEEQTKEKRKSKSYMKESQGLQKLLDEANEKIQELERMLVQKDEKISELQNKVDSFNGENEELKIKVARLEGKLSVVQKSSLVEV